jgi:hypothetical protein
MSGNLLKWCTFPILSYVAHKEDYNFINFLPLQIFITDFQTMILYYCNIILKSYIFKKKFPFR